MAASARQLLGWIRPRSAPVEPPPPPPAPDRRTASELLLLGVVTFAAGLLILAGAPVALAALPLAGLVARFAIPRLARLQVRRELGWREETRVITQDLYGLNGVREGAEVSAELPAGTVIRITPDQHQLEAEDMRFALDPALLARIRSHSRGVA